MTETLFEKTVSEDVPSTNMQEAGLWAYTAANQQGEIQMSGCPSLFTVCGHSGLLTRKRRLKEDEEEYQHMKARE